MDVIKLEATWNEHKLGGMKRSGGEVVPVSFSDFYMKHCYKSEGAHELMSTIVNHIEEDNIQAIHQMRSKGFQSYKCENCASAGIACSSQKLYKSNVPPRVLHYPRLAFRTSNSTGAPALKHYGSPEGVSAGVIVSDVVKGGLMDRSGLQKYDFIYKITTPHGSYDIDNYGETWMPNLQVSLPMNDTIHRAQFWRHRTDSYCTRTREEDPRHGIYLSQGRIQAAHPFIRLLQDMPLTRQIVKWRV